ncbi:MAG: hypothetical protein KDD47_26140 [Acidobacteria bacterium]|nr:hypothetical protein [Acidobacteriota bacterium]
MLRAPLQRSVMLAILLPTLWAGCASPRAPATQTAVRVRQDEPAPGALSTEPGAILRDVPGAVVRVGEDWWGLVPDADPGTRFAPDELPAAYRQEGLAVRFSGTVGEVPRGVRLWGIPFDLSSIERRP